VPRRKERDHRQRIPADGSIAGGTAGEGEIEIQGDHVVRVAAELEGLGYRVRKA
jgi:translation initiation factor 1 (eIF-1/SUI1)